MVQSVCRLAAALMKGAEIKLQLSMQFLNILKDVPYRVIHAENSVSCNGNVFQEAKF